MSTSRGMTAFVLTLSFGAVMIAACDTQPDRNEGITTPTPTTMMTPMTSPTVSPGMTPGMTPSASLTPFEKDFVMDAARWNDMEVKLTDLATQKASNSDVKRFNERLVTDHNQANQWLRQLTTTLNIALPQDLEPEQRNEISRLDNLTGKEFDREFIKTIINTHTKELSEYERAATQATSPEVKQFAAQMLPTLREHMKMAREVAGKVGVKLPQSQ